MAEYSRQYLPAGLKRISASLVLRPDGTFTASEIPGAFHGTSDLVDKTSGGGRWTLVNREGRQQVQLNFAGDFGWQLNISSWRTRTLQYTLDDPDLGHEIEYQKASR